MINDDSPAVIDGADRSGSRVATASTTAALVANLEADAVTLQPLLDDVARDLHAHPEIRFVEFHATARLTAELETAGFSVERGYADLETAFVGRWSAADADPGDPTVAIFLEFDALEGIGHACGHNLIAASGLGAAVLTKRYLEAHPEFRGHLLAVGSPGEEGGAGKQPMIDAGVLQGVDVAMMTHPAGSNAVHFISHSRVALDVEFLGRASHAASAPELGINALDAATLALTGIGLLRQQLPDNSRIHGIIVDGGQAPNIIPEYTHLRMFVRHIDREVLLETILPRVYKVIEGAAIATGCGFTIEERTPRYDGMITNPRLGQVATDALGALGRVVPVGALPMLGSTDMGNVSLRVPSIHPMLELVAGATPHTREFASAAEGENAPATIHDGAVMLAATALTLFVHPEVRAEL